MLPDDQVHPDTHVLTMVNNVIGVVNYVIAARPSLRNFVIADTYGPEAPAIGAGTTGGGPDILGSPQMPSLSWEELARDLRLARPFAIRY